MSWTADPVFCLDVLRELDLFWVLPRQQQVQLALWAGELGYKFFNCSILSIARLIIQTLQTRCAFCLLHGGTFSPSLSTCSTPSSLWQGRNTMLFMKNWLSIYFQEEIQPRVSSACDPPQHPSVALLVGTKVSFDIWNKITNITQMEGT